MPDFPFQSRAGGAPPVSGGSAGSDLTGERIFEISDRSVASPKLEALKAALLDRVTIPGAPLVPFAEISANSVLTGHTPAQTNSGATPPAPDSNSQRPDSARYRESFMSELPPNDTRRVAPSLREGEKAGGTERADPPENNEKRQLATNNSLLEGKASPLELRAEGAKAERETTARTSPVYVPGTEPIRLEIARTFIDAQADHPGLAPTEYMNTHALDSPRQALETKRSVDDIVAAFSSTLLRDPSRTTASAIAEALSRGAPPPGEPPLRQPEQVLPGPETHPTVTQLHRSITARLDEMRSSVELMSTKPSYEPPLLDKPTQRGAVDQIAIQPVASKSLPLLHMEKREDSRQRETEHQGSKSRDPIRRVRGPLAGHVDQERIVSLLTAMELGARRVKFLRALQSIDNALETGCISLAAVVALGALGLEQGAMLIVETAKKVAATIKESRGEPNNVADSSITELIHDLSSTPQEMDEAATKQDYTSEVAISGRVVYSGTQVPVVGIAIDGGILGTATTDGTGAFTFKRVSVGIKFTLQFPTQKLEYETPIIQGLASADSNFVIQAKKRSKRRSDR